MLNCLQKLLSLMLLVRITNSTDVVASKTHKLVARMTPEETDLNIVESAVIKQMGEDLASEGLVGEITIVKGLEVERETLVTKKGFSIKQKRMFGKTLNQNSDKFDIYKPR